MVTEFVRIAERVTERCGSDRARCRRLLVRLWRPFATHCRVDDLVDAFLGDYYGRP